MSEALRERQVTAELTAAFQASGIERLSPEDMLYWRRHLPLLESEVFLRFLPAVLIDLVGRHSLSSMEKSDDTEFVLMQIEPRVVRGEELRALILEAYGDDALRDDEKFERDRGASIEQNLVGFSVEQARAILHWLELASGWNNTIGMEISWISAMEYWSERSGECVDQIKSTVIYRNLLAERDERRQSDRPAWPRAWSAPSSVHRSPLRQRAEPAPAPEQVERELEASFHLARLPSLPRHDEEAFAKVVRSPPALFISELPVKLIRLISRHERSGYDVYAVTELDRVIIALNATEVANAAIGVYRNAQPDVELAEAEGLEAMRSAKRAVYQRFNARQSSAIWQWLLLANAWPESDECEDDLIGALLYWQARAMSATP